LDIQALVDRLVAHRLPPVTTMITGQHQGDQPRRPPLIHPRLDIPAQLLVPNELELLRPGRRLLGQGISDQGVVVPIITTMTLDLPAHRRTMPTQLPGNRSTGLTLIKPTLNLVAILQRQPMPQPTHATSTRRPSHTTA